MRHKHTITAHVYDKRGILLAVATNSYTKTHPLQKYFAEKVGHPHREFLHAEIAALLKCKDKEPHSIFISRFNNNGFPMLAKPCPICMEAIKAFGIVKIGYTK